eukprot:Rhum_TRINITY_DN7850_c0_g1::Rhum_TRINITY_DN7850_c0_g1_i1::g.24893::m.24893/K08059/IFI30, GILT; interferon, gamma-inducible protein 30
MQIMDFQYVAFGNGKWNGSTLTCQHGPLECFGNMAENCVANLTAYDPVRYMPFAACLEDGKPQTKAKVDSCCAKTKIDTAKVTQCMNSPLGPLLVKEAAAATPPHKYVPDVVGPDGKGFAIFRPSDLISKVCGFWTGVAPSFCKNQTSTH